MILIDPSQTLSTATWIDLLEPTAEEAEQVTAATGLRVPTEAQISEIESTSRLGFESGAYYVSTPLVSPRPDGEHGLMPVGFVLSDRILLTVRFAALSSIDTAHAQWGAQGTWDPQDAFLRILEIVVDRAADKLEHAGSECDELSRSTFRRGPRAGLSSDLQAALQRVGAAANGMSLIRDGLLGVGRIGAYLMESRFEGAPRLNVARMSAIRADVASLTDYEAHLAGKVQFLLDATLGFINIEQNEIVKILTVASVVGIPPVLVVGIYGMNFHVMPELGWRYGYLMALVLVVVTALLPLLWFKRRGWL